MPQVAELLKQIETAVELARSAELSAVQYLLEMAINDVKHQIAQRERQSNNMD